MYVHATCVQTSQFYIKFVQFSLVEQAQFTCNSSIQLHGQTQFTCYSSGHAV